MSGRSEYLRILEIFAIEEVGANSEYQLEYREAGKIRRPMLGVWAILRRVSHVRAREPTGSKTGCRVFG